MEIVKQSKNLGTLVMKEIDRDLAKSMIIDNHYSHKWNTAFGKINIGIHKDNELLGVASFGNLMNPKSYKKISSKFEQDNVIELNRLWISDKLGKNAETILLGASWTIIKNCYPHIKAVQSFADGRLGCGTIYKAASFKYYGYTTTLFYENIKTKEIQHKVPMENTMRPNGFIRLNREYCEGLLKPFYVKTYRYIFPLYKNVSIDLEEKPYPAYDKGFEYIDDYKHSQDTLTRAFVLARLLGQDDDANVIKCYLDKNYSDNENLISLLKALENKSILKISQERKLDDKFIKIYNEILGI